MTSKDAGSADDTPSVRVGKLDTLEAVRRELGRLYRAARRTAGPDPDAATASRLAYLLVQIGRSIEGTELETRIAALERQAGARR
jgi:hypothetical protein